MKESGLCWDIMARVWNAILQARQHDTLRATEHWRNKSLPTAIMETRGSGSTAPVYNLVTTWWWRDLHAPATLTPVYFGQETRWAAQPGEPWKIKLLAATGHRTRDSLVFRSEVHYQKTQIANLIYSNYTLPFFAGDDGNKFAVPCVLCYGLSEGGMGLLSEMSRAALGLTEPHIQ
jgi:hypothetical protein